MFSQWLFLGLAAAAVIVLRRKAPELERPYRTWGYPLVPLAFIAGCCALTLSLWLARPLRSTIGLVLILADFRCTRGSPGPGSGRRDLPLAEGIVSQRTVLLVGTGIQGRAAIQDLERSPGVDRVIAADLDGPALERYLDGIGARKTEATTADVRDGEALRRLMSCQADVAIALVPAKLEPLVARAVVEAGTNLVTTNYATSVAALADVARAPAE